MRMKQLLVFILVSSLFLFACTDNNEEVENEHVKEVVEIQEEQVEEEMSFKEECEFNAEENPAGPGTVLVTKGDFDFTGMKYYFKGEFLGSGVAEQFEGQTVWLIKNDKGYIMPVEMPDNGEEPAINSEVEIWGTLTGDGYSIPDIDNVVGQTGYMVMMQYNVDGEMIM